MGLERRCGEAGRGFRCDISGCFLDQGNFVVVFVVVGVDVGLCMYQDTATASYIMKEFINC